MAPVQYDSTFAFADPTPASLCIFNEHCYSAAEPGKQFWAKYCVRCRSSFTDNGIAFQLEPKSHKDCINGWTRMGKVERKTREIIERAYDSKVCVCNITSFPPNRKFKSHSVDSGEYCGSTDDLRVIYLPLKETGCRGCWRRLRSSDDNCQLTSVCNTTEEEDSTFNSTPSSEPQQPVFGSNTVEISDLEDDFDLLNCVSATASRAHKTIARRTGPAIARPSWLPSTSKSTTTSAPKTLTTSTTTTRRPVATSAQYPSVPDGDLSFKPLSAICGPSQSTKTSTRPTHDSGSNKRARVSDANGKSSVDDDERCVSVDTIYRVLHEYAYQQLSFKVITSIMADIESD